MWQKDELKDTESREASKNVGREDMAALQSQETSANLAR